MRAVTMNVQPAINQTDAVVKNTFPAFPAFAKTRQDSKPLQWPMADVQLHHTPSDDIQAGETRGEPNRIVDADSTCCYTWSDMCCTESCLTARWETLCQGRKSQTHGLNESAGGRGIPHVLPTFLLNFTFMINSLHHARKTWPLLCSWRPHLFVFWTNSTCRDTPTLVSPPGGNCVQRWKGGGAWRESMSRLDLAREAFLSSVQASMSEPEPEAAVARSEGFNSCTRPELCVIQKLSKTRQSLSVKVIFSICVLLSITVLCRNTSSREPRE